MWDSPIYIVYMTIDTTRHTHPIITSTLRHKLSAGFKNATKKNKAVTVHGSSLK